VRPEQEVGILQVLGAAHLGSQQEVRRHRAVRLLVGHCQHAPVDDREHHHGGGGTVLLVEGLDGHLGRLAGDVTRTVRLQGGAYWSVTPTGESTLRAYLLPAFGVNSNRPMPWLTPGSLSSLSVCTATSSGLPSSRSTPRRSAGLPSVVRTWK